MSVSGPNTDSKSSETVCRENTQNLFNSYSLPCVINSSPCNKARHTRWTGDSANQQIDKSMQNCTTFLFLQNLYSMRFLLKRRHLTSDPSDEKHLKDVRMPQTHFPRSNKTQKWPQNEQVQTCPAVTQVLGWIYDFRILTPLPGATHWQLESLNLLSQSGLVLDGVCKELMTDSPTRSQVCWHNSCFGGKHNKWLCGFLTSLLS